MKISCRRKIAIDSRKDAIVIPVYKNIKSLRYITGKKLDDELQEIIKTDYFNFEEYEIKSFYFALNKKIKKIYLVNAPKEQVFVKEYMSLGSKMARILKQDKISSISIISFEDIYNEKRNFSSTQGFIEGLLFGLYSFDKFKTKKDSYSISDVEVITSMLKFKKYIDEKGDELLTIFDNVNLVRDLINTPSNHLTPKDFVNMVREYSPENLKVTVWNKEQIIENGLNLIEAVGRGSANEPYFLQLEYIGDKETDSNIALVGKGITFDTGGYNLKPTGSMETMKIDKAGASTVFAVTRLIALLNMKVNINTFIPLAENCISNNSLKPSDVVTSASGKTVEIMNTDAEGRLILADALYMATKKDPDVIIDVATLTGACVVALGPYCAGLFSNRRFLGKQFDDASYETCEDLWELPLFEDYECGLKSPVADMQNMSTFKREGGAIHAALFLKQFVDNYPWVHIDIAGTVFIEKPHPIFNTGASGYGVRLIHKFIEKNYTK